MAVQAAPIEWTRGDSRVGWVIYLSLAIFVALAATSLLLYFFVYPFVGGGHNPRVLALVSDVVGFPVILVVLTIWWACVPSPASRLGLSPEGVAIDYGLRTVHTPWSRIMTSGERLYVISRITGFATPFQLTRYQVSRVANIRPDSGRQLGVR
jgi:hypothetical protein